MIDKEKIRNIIELFIAWNGETEAIDVANLDSAVDFIADSLQKELVSIWHDSSEKADIHKGNIVAISSIGTAAAFNQGSTAIYFMGDYDIEQWAYVNDLLKL